MTLHASSLTYFQQTAEVAKVSHIIPFRVDTGLEADKYQRSGFGSAGWG
jgi:hypothetical protein